VLCNPVAANPTVDQWFNPSCLQQTPDTTGTFGTMGRNSVRGPGDFNIDMSVIKNTRFGNINTEIRVEAFNVFNHLQLANPNTTYGSSSFGTITAMLASPSCATCGTTERQIQLGFKVRF
jgi:hypothetical protein